MEHHRPLLPLITIPSTAPVRLPHPVLLPPHHVLLLGLLLRLLLKVRTPRPLLQAQTHNLPLPLGRRIQLLKVRVRQIVLETIVVLVTRQPRDIPPDLIQRPPRDAIRLATVLALATIPLPATQRRILWTNAIHLLGPFSRLNQFALCVLATLSATPTRIHTATGIALTRVTRGTTFTGTRVTTATRIPGRTTTRITTSRRTTLDTATRADRLFSCLALWRAGTGLGTCLIGGAFGGLTTTSTCPCHHNPRLQLLHRVLLGCDSFVPLQQLLGTLLPEGKI